jgi:hypothetical protein
MRSAVRTSRTSRLLVVDARAAEPARLIWKYPRVRGAHSFDRARPIVAPSPTGCACAGRGHSGARLRSATLPGLIRCCAEPAEQSDDKGGSRARGDVGVGDEGVTRRPESRWTPAINPSCMRLEGAAGLRDDGVPPELIIVCQGPDPSGMKARTTPASGGRALPDRMAIPISADRSAAFSRPRGWLIRRGSIGVAGAEGVRRPSTRSGPLVPRGARPVARFLRRPDGGLHAGQIRRPCRQRRQVPLAP